MTSSSDTLDDRTSGAAFGRDLTTGSVARNLLFFSVPMLLGNAIHTAYSIINTAWVGNGLGAESMAAITVSFPIVFVLIAVAGGLTLATNILVSQAFGAKNLSRVRTIAQNSFLLTAMVSVVCLVVGRLTAALLVRATNTPADVVPIAVSYLRLFLFITPFMFGIFHLSSVLRGVGDSKTPLYFQAASLLLTGILDPILMFGWLGAPRLGLNGTAVATIIATTLAFVTLSAYLRRIGHIAAPAWGRWKLDAALSRLTLKIGLPSMLQQSFVAVGILLIVGLVNGFGAHCAAAYGVGMRIDQLAFMPAMAMGMAASTLAGQNIGALRFNRVGAVLRWAILIAFLLTLPGSIATLAIPRHLMGLFTPDADVVETGAHYLRIAGVSYLFVAVMFSTNGVINGSGHTIPTTIFTLVVFYAVRIPLAVLLSRRLGHVEGIWYAILASYTIGVTMGLTYYRSGLWKKPVHTRPRHAPPETPAAPAGEEGA